MNWRKTDGGYNAHPYVVRWQQGGRWVARKLCAQHIPLHLGTFDTANAAKSACQEHYDEFVVGENYGWGGK